jgi:hypothetical protein
MVIAKKRWVALAPSTLAASYSSPGMLCRPASMSRARNGNHRQALIMITVGRAHFTDPRKSMGASEMPRVVTRKFTIP